MVQSILEIQQATTDCVLHRKYNLIIICTRIENHSSNNHCYSFLNLQCKVIRVKLGQNAPSTLLTKELSFHSIISKIGRQLQKQKRLWNYSLFYTAPHILKFKTATTSCIMDTVYSQRSQSFLQFLQSQFWNTLVPRWRCCRYRQQLHRTEVAPPGQLQSDQ